MTGMFSPDVAALDWAHLRNAVVQRGVHTLGAVPPQLRAQVAEQAGAHGLTVRHQGGVLVLELKSRGGRSAGPRLPRGGK